MTPILQRLVAQLDRTTSRLYTERRWQRASACDGMANVIADALSGDPMSRTLADRWVTL